VNSDHSGTSLAICHIQGRFFPLENDSDCFRIEHPSQQSFSGAHVSHPDKLARTALL